MEFLRERCFTSLNADELRAGDKVIVAYNLYGLKEQVKMFTESAIDVIEVIQDEDYFNRFKVKHGESFPLAYLVERRENCLKCKKCEVISDKSMHCDWVGTGPITSARVEKCNHYEPKTEKSCTKCRMATKLSDGTLACDVDGFPVDCTPPHDEACSDYKPKTEQKAEKHYRPFKDTDELIKVWDAKIGTPKWGTDGDLTMPLIWVRDPKRPKCTYLLNGLIGNEVHLGSYIFNMQELFDNFELLDGSVCGVEE